MIKIPSLTIKQKGKIRRRFVENGGRRGFQAQMAREYGVARTTIANIINNGGTLRRHTVDTEEAKQKLMTINHKINTLENRKNMLDLLDADIKHLQKKLYVDKEELTFIESKRLNMSLKSMEDILKGVDQINKNDIHYHVGKIIITLENMNDEQGQLLIPHIKSLICEGCPHYKRYHNAIDVEGKEI